MNINCNRMGSLPVLLPTSWLILSPEADPESRQTASAGCVVLDLCAISGAPESLQTLIPTWSAITGRSAAAVLIPSVSTSGIETLIGFAVTISAHYIILSQASVGADLEHLDVMLQVAEARQGKQIGSTRIVAMIGDNPRGLLAAADFSNRTERLVALSWDRERLARAIGRNDKTLPASLETAARGTLLLAAAAAGVAALDTADITTSPESFNELCRDAKEQGFAGKMSRDASQIPLMDAHFQPAISGPVQPA